MRGFSCQHTITVELSRGNERLSLELFALPPGWRAALRSAYPPPMVYERNKAPQPDPARTGEWWEAFTRLSIGKALEPSGILDTKIEGINASDWQRVDRELSAEFAAANLTDGDLATLAEAIRREFLEADGNGTGN